jgi:hypothetical protein
MMFVDFRASILDSFKLCFLFFRLVVRKPKDTRRNANKSSRLVGGEQASHCVSSSIKRGKRDNYQGIG